MKRENRILLYEILFSIYALVMVFFLFFWDRSNFSTGNYIEDLKYHLQYRPFTSIKSYVKLFSKGYAYDYVIRNFIGNVIMFIPLGLFLPAVKRRFRRLKRFIPVVLLILLGIETSQLLLLRGVFDVDDIILNLLGALMGFFINIPLRRLRRKIDRKITKKIEAREGVNDD